jgi:hypothetical protein
MTAAEKEMTEQYEIELLAKRIMGIVQFYGPQWREVTDAMNAKRKIEDVLRVAIRAKKGELK